ncbi:MAG TPA: peptidase S41, partial [Chitinophagaceae bacterium]|nr:peptidase S41 [Chitinophagaceae bacterium]
MKTAAVILLTALLLSACGTGKLVVTPHTKYAPEQLQKDYAVYRKTLEAHHPSLYWYTPRDS